MAPKSTVRAAEARASKYSTAVKLWMTPDTTGAASGLSGWISTAGSSGSGCFRWDFHSSPEASTLASETSGRVTAKADAGMRSRGSPPPVTALGADPADAPSLGADAFAFASAAGTLDGGSVGISGATSRSDAVFTISESV